MSNINFYEDIDETKNVNYYLDARWLDTYEDEERRFKDVS